MRTTTVELSEKEKDMGLLGVTASVEMILFGYSNEDTNDEEERESWVAERRLNVVPSAKPTPCPTYLSKGCTSDCSS
jgi:hypothetical protein